jgi:uncharacterized protein (DUF433 family)
VNPGRHDAERVAEMFQSDSDVMGGAPVFRGTRIPVYLIADMIEQGVPIEEILDGYPSLTREMVEWATANVTSQPRSDQPSVQPWSGTQPVNRKRSRLRRGTGD